MKAAPYAFLAAILVSVSGCVTMVDESVMTRQQADMDILREDIQKLNERLKGVQLEQQNLARDMDAIRKAPREDADTRARLDNLDRQIKAVSAARETDRKQIVEEISRKVATIVNGSSGGSSGGGKSSSGTETGYEHVVKPGESLSKIAREYKVSVSAIMKANNLKSSDTVRAGQKLFIPQP